MDTALASCLQGGRTWDQAVDLNRSGALAETWIHHHLNAFRVVTESSAALHYFHTASQDECDFVLEEDRLIPLEVKMTQTPSSKVAAGLEVFLELFPKRSPFGLLLHAGTELVPMAERVIAVPMASFLIGPALDSVS